MTDYAPLSILESPTAYDIGETAEAWLDKLSGPTIVRLPGRERSRVRAFSTLLHGNEPSGLKALHRWITKGEVPAVDLVCFIVSVEAAKLAPIFSHRQRPGCRDQNRCFRPPFDDLEGQVAESILATLENQRPEALIDMHNTSGMGPSFGVSICDDETHRSLTSLFTQRLIVTDLRLGALMEYSERKVPTVTIECGGAQDDEAHEIAWEGFCRYVREDRILVPDQSADWDVEVLVNPVRVEVSKDCRVSYRPEPDPEADITLRPDIEHFNFGVIHVNQPLGWVTPDAMQVLSVRNHKGEDVRSHVLKSEGGRLFPAQDLRAFMITTNPEIARSDCLFYAIPDQGEPF